MHHCQRGVEAERDAATASQFLTASLCSARVLLTSLKVKKDLLP
jgi:hypothetical protein